MSDYRVGKCVEKPNPKCHFCNNYLKLERSITNDLWWFCHTCEAQYEAIKKKNRGGG